ncbi:TetR/AcrR family transcriptional regulator [Mycolicibacter nonchromogenicus]|uniref:TetR/AcrR family transcriptional regulator n=1 Tax=Mycolicibacter nonchromogenicus TaxID=1782 RepID=UPI0009EDCB80|nr:TetR/AcrR family transcriptional regulator [Mycolicibacter nonchromogenicus]
MTDNDATGNPIDQTTSAREEAVAAVLVHAADLFAERGPAATSIRDISTRSGVNHGLVFRYLGTKNQLVKAVLNHLADEVAEAVQAGAPAQVIAARTELQWRVLARAILDGFPVGQLQERFPIAANLLKHGLSSYDEETTGRLAAANVMALQLGWQLFQPFLRSAAGIEDLPSSDLRQSVTGEIARMLKTSPSEVFRIAFPVS